MPNIKINNLIKYAKHGRTVMTTYQFDEHDYDAMDDIIEQLEEYKESR